MDESPWPQKWGKKQRASPHNGGSRITGPSPPLGGASKCLPGRSSDLQAPYLLGFPADVGQCWCELSFLLTAAGQLRILTGFPFHSVPRHRTPRMMTTLYGVTPHGKPYILTLCGKARFLQCQSACNYIASSISLRQSDHEVLRPRRQSQIGVQDHPLCL